jgi:serine/threonine protein kinase
MPDVMKTVGRYEILRDIGRGGMAIVYLARQTDLDRFVALKELGAFHASDPSFAQRFLRESRVAGSLSHPNIVTVHDYFEHDGTPYIAMEYIERGSLRPYVGHMTLAQIGGVLEGLLAGLAHAEEHGIVHRDLKPENLMVTAEGRVKIADFGIAKATNQMQTGAFLTATGTTVGTPTYMAPEQAMAQDIGPWTDLYSVGCMAFEMFVGRVPFHDSEAPMAILLRHVNEPIPPARSVHPEVDQAVSDWIEELLVKDPTRRTRSANEAWDAFEEIIIGLLGPRWRREARLTERAQTTTPKPLTPAPFQGTSQEQVSSDEFESFAWRPSETPAGEAAVAPPGPATPPPADAPPGPLVPGEVDVPTGPPTPAGLPVAEEPAVAEPPAPAAPEAQAPPVAEPPAPAAEPPAPAAEEPVVAEPPAEETGFVTFGAPAPAMPSDAIVTPPEEPAVAEPPAPAAPPAAEEPAVAGPPPPAAEEPPVAEPPSPVAPGAAAAAAESLAPEAQGPEVAEPPAPEAEAPAVAEPAAPAFETYVAPAPSRPPTEEPPPDAPALTPPPSEAAPPPPVSAPPPPPQPEPVAPEPEPVAAMHSPAREEIAPTVMPDALPEPSKPARAPKPAKPPKPAREPRERSWPSWLPFALGGGVLVAAVLGFVLASGGGGDKAPTTETPSAPAAAKGVQVLVPPDWEKLASAPEIPGVKLDEPVAFGPAGTDGGGQSVSLGNVADGANNFALLTPDFLAAAGFEGGKVPPRKTVKLGDNGVQAYEYENLSVKGAPGKLTVFAVPTTAGVATVVCSVPAQDCEAIANTLKLSDGKAFPVGPSKEFGDAVSKALGDVNKASQTARARMKAAKTNKSQAPFAAKAATAYDQAAKSIEQLEVSPADAGLKTLMVSSLRDGQKGFKRLSTAASKHDNSGYKKAQADIATAQQELQGAVRALAAAGYQVG